MEIGNKWEKCNYLTVMTEEYDICWELSNFHQITMELGNFKMALGVVGEGERDNLLTDKLGTSVGRLIVMIEILREYN